MKCTGLLLLLYSLLLVEIKGQGEGKNEEKQGPAVAGRPAWALGNDGLRYRAQGEPQAALNMKAEGGVPGRYIVGFYQLEDKAETAALDIRIEKLVNELGKNNKFMTTKLLPCRAETPDSTPKFG